MARLGRGFPIPATVLRFRGETTPPSYSVAAAVSAVASSTVNIGLTATDDLGGGVTSYLQLYAAGSTPINAEVVAGTGTGVISGKNDSSFAASGAPTVFAQLTGLTNGHPYRAAIAIRDSYNNFATVTYVDFYTTLGQATLGEVEVSGFAGVLGNPKTVSISNLAYRSGAVRPDLNALHWAWFDEDDIGTLTTPTDQGTAETTDGSGSISITLANSALTSGQYGRLFLETSDKVSLGHYRLAIP